MRILARFSYPVDKSNIAMQRLSVLLGTRVPEFSPPSEIGASSDVSLTFDFVFNRRGYQFCELATCQTDRMSYTRNKHIQMEMK